MTTEIDEYIAAHKAKIAKERREAYEKAAANVENNQTVGDFAYVPIST